MVRLDTLVLIAASVWVAGMVIYVFARSGALTAIFGG